MRSRGLDLDLLGLEDGHEVGGRLRAVPVLVLELERDREGQSDAKRALEESDAELTRLGLWADG